MTKNAWNRGKVCFLLFAIILFCSASGGYGSELTNNNWDSFGGWWQKQWIPNGASIASDTTSPDSPNVLKFYFPSGYLGGNAPATVGFKAPAAVNEFWVQYYFKYSSNWEFHPVADKQLYIYSEPSHSVSNANVQVVTMTYYNTLILAVAGQAYPNGHAVIRTNPPFMPTRGRWYKLDLHVKMNNPHGTANGIAELWIDGNKLINVSNVMYLLADSSDSGFQSFNFSPVYGGAGSQKSHDDYVYFDKAIISTSLISGSPLPDPSITDKVPSFPQGLTIQGQ